MPFTDCSWSIIEDATEEEPNRRVGGVGAESSYTAQCLFVFINWKLPGWHHLDVLMGIS